MGTVTEMSDSSETAFPEPEFREYAIGRLPNQDHKDVHRHAGLVTDDTARFLLTRMVEAYEPLTPDAPESAWEMGAVQRVVRQAGTETAQQALESGNYGVLNFMSGLVSYQRDASGLRSLNRLHRLIEDTPVFISYIYGIMGSGKTDFSMLLVEMFRTVYGGDSVDVWTNFQTYESDITEVHRYSEIIEELEVRGEEARENDGTDDEMLIIIDEAAQIFTGSGSDQQKAKHLAKLLKLARKSGAHVILIGQDGKDVGPSLRALCTVFVKKESKKKASFYRDVNDREGVDKMMSLSGVPGTGLGFQTYDEGSFVFDVDDDADDVDVEELERDIERHKRRMMAVLDAADNDMTQAEIAETYDVAERTVRRSKDHVDLDELGF